jgi:transketolase
LDIKYCLTEAIRINGPVYLRISASDAIDTISAERHPTYKQSYLINEGSEIALITTGITLRIGKDLSDILSTQHGISVKHLHFSTIKPIDKNVIAGCANTVKWMFTIEEHNVIGGLGSAVAEISSEIGIAKLHRFGIMDHYCSPGTQQYIFEKEGLTVDSLQSEIKHLLSE